jgi:Tol biopolymer transport system component
MKRAIRLMIFMLVGFLVACETNTAPSIEASLLTDADLDRALRLETNSSLATVNLDDTAMLDLSTTISQESALTRSGWLSQLESESIRIPVDTESYIAFVQQYGSANNPRFTIRIQNTNSNRETIVFNGRRAIESVAVSGDGQLVTFIAKDASGVFQVYAYDLSGDYLGQRGQLVQLTATPFNEGNISMSLDGKTHSWDSQNAAGVPVFNVAVIDLANLIVSETIFDFSGLPVFQPSLSGDGSVVVFVADLGTTLAIAVIPVDSTSATVLVTGNVRDPSLNLDGTQLMFALRQGNNDFVVYDDGVSLTVLVVAPTIIHPYMTADALYFTYAIDRRVIAQELNAEDPAAADRTVIFSRDTLSSPYWAKFNFDVRYIGSTLGGPTFVRPDNEDGLSPAERTVPYHVYTFISPVTDTFTIDSAQDFDGYLFLYDNRFDPRNPERNLIAANDDFGGFFNPNNDPPGRSRIVADLSAFRRYIIVTTAYDSSQFSAGRFVNRIFRGEEPEPDPIELPEPDPTQYNITLVFAEDETTQSLTEAQRQVFVDAAARWEAIITEDLAPIENVSLPANAILPGTPPVVGTIDDVLIFVRFGNLGGPLGRAGPRFIRSEGTEDEFLTTVGLMEFEIDEFQPGGFFENQQQYEDVIVHEMGHVIGIGTLWNITGNTEGILTNPPTVPPGLPNPDYDPRFTGPGAVAEYQTLLSTAGKALETTVPIANSGGPGNFNGHWRELTFDNELMTPFAGGLELLSRMTAASLGDIGYTVNVDSDAVDQNYQLPLPAEFEQLSPNAVTYTELVDFLKFSGAAGEVTATVQAVDLALANPGASTSGCEPSDFAGFTAGNIALMQRGTCPFVDKVQNAVDAGAVGVIMFNQGDTNDPSRTGLFRPSTGTNAIPAVATTFGLGVELAGLVDSGLTVRISTPVPEMMDATALEVAARAPTFEEELLFPIGTISPDGKVTLFGE